MILIYSKDIDDFVNQVIDYLDEDFIRIGNRDIISIKDFKIGKESNFKISNHFFKNKNLVNLSSIWFNGGSIHSNGSFHENECYQTLIDSFLTNLSLNKIGRLYNPIETDKIHTSLEAKKQGFKIPETIITSSKKTLKKFYNKYKKKHGIICKRITDDSYYNDNEYIYNFISTFLIDSDILNKVPNNFAISLFQERILAEFEVRAFYIQGNFYAMSIHTFDNGIDYRKKLNSPKKIRKTPFKLPTIVKNKLKKIFRNLNLNYGSADLMYHNDEYYFLEINPCGQIGYLNEACNYYIENDIAKLLKNEK